MAEANTFKSVQIVDISENSCLLVYNNISSIKPQQLFIQTPPKTLYAA